VKEEGGGYSPLGSQEAETEREREREREKGGQGLNIPCYLCPPTVQLGPTSYSFHHLSTVHSIMNLSVA
jgi:hypothetical protein